MKKTLKILGISLGIIVLILIAGGFLIPQTWTVSESVEIEASSEAIYDQIANLKHWQNWSPWNLERDKTQIYTYEGPEIGEGAKWLWTSQDMGKGYLEILEASVEKGIKYTLFIDMNGMQSTINADMVFEKIDDKIKLTWTDRGDSGTNLAKRWMSFMIKPMVGKELASGLAKLKGLVESKSNDIQPENTNDLEAELK